MAVNQLIPARILEQRHHHDRDLLALLGQRGPKTPLPLRAPKPQVLVPHLELVKFQIHPKIPRGAGSALAGSHTVRGGSLVPLALDQTGA